MRIFIFSVAVLSCWVFLAGQIQAQTSQTPAGPSASPVYQNLITKGNQALAGKNYTQAIHFFAQAVHLFPRDVPARTLLTNAQTAYKTAKAAYDTSFEQGRAALRQKNFQGATTAFTNAATFLPADQHAGATIQRYLAGTAALQSALTSVAAGNYTDAAQKYATAHHLLGQDRFAQVPLNEVRLALVESRNPTPYFNKDIQRGLVALQHRQLSQAKNFFKSAFDLPVNLTEKDKAQTYYDGSDALEKGFAGLTANPPDYAMAMKGYVVAVAKVSNNNHAHRPIAQLKAGLADALHDEVVRGNRFLKINDLEGAFMTANNVKTLLTLFPDSVAAQRFLTSFQNRGQVDLRQALNNGYINANTFSATGHDQSSIKIGFQSSKTFTWFLKVPMGTIFQGRVADTTGTTTALQNMVLLTDSSSEVKPGNANQFQLPAATLNPAAGTPLPTDVLVLTNQTPPANLAKILLALQAASADPRVKQFAVWIVLNKNLRSTDISIGSASPSTQEIAVLRTIFTAAGLNPQGYLALQ